MRYFVIVNPLSGRGTGEKSIPIIEKWLHACNMDFTLARTERPWQAADLAQKAAVDGYNVVVTASGDGTFNETLNGLMRARQQGYTSTALGVLTLGTGNDFAAGANIPGTLEESLKVLNENKRRRIDIGRVTVREGENLTERYFGNGIGIGFDAMVGFEAVKVRWAVGLVPYLIGVVKTISLYFTSPFVRLTLDDQTFEQPALMTSIMNGRRMGGGFIMAPEGVMDDSWFNLCIASEASRMRLFQLIPYFLKGTQASQPEIKMLKAKRVTITALKGSLPAHADGEMLCVQGSELNVELLPEAIEIISQ
jgi:YegS/Rv2252/BmrU family lipid kinase